MNKLKKFLAGIMAMTCMLSTVSCFESKEINESKAEQQSSQIQEMMEKSYKAIEMEAELHEIRERKRESEEKLSKLQELSNTGEHKSCEQGN